MLTVILTILKIIGIILAVLIGLVLLIVLLVGFVPIRYKASGEYPYEGRMNEEVVSKRKRAALMNKVKASDEKTEDEFGEDVKELKIRVNAVVSWLLHIVHVSVDMDSTGLIITARLFGFKIYSTDPETVKKKEEKRKKKEEKARLKAEKNGKKEEKNEEPEEITEIEKTEKSEDEKEKKESTEVVKTEGDKESKEDNTEKDIEDKESNKEENKEENKDKTEKEEPEKLSFIEKIQNKFEGIKNKLASLKKKKDYILDMKDDKRVRNGISYAKDKLFLIIKRVLPKKLEGRVAFGMEDPSTTGKITAGACLFYCLWGNHFTLEPDFDNKKLEADVSLKGRIVLALLVIPALKVWFNKDIKYIRKKVGGFKKL
ncbi:MAG: DUF2953 domain-containing protein [Lachnospiraceae bacterium]|nr:DUF2953 domain-containing protein [Lachnospiraceae bacterium]